VLVSRFYHDDLGMMPAFHMLGLRDSLRTDCLGMMQNLILHLVFFKHSISRFGISIACSKRKVSLSCVISTFANELYPPASCQLPLQGLQGLHGERVQAAARVNRISSLEINVNTAAKLTARERFVYG